MADESINAYELIELDPAVTDQAGAIAHLEAKRKWANTLPNDAVEVLTRRAARLKINEPEIRAVLTDEPRRLAHAKEYRQILNARAAAARPLLDVLKLKGGYAAADVAEIARSQKLPEPEVVKLLAKAGIHELTGAAAAAAKKAAAAAYRPPDRTDVKVAAQIESDLIPANVDSLYAYLGPQFGPSSSAANLRQRFDDMKVESSRANRDSEKHKSDSRLLKHVEIHLLDPGARKKYDSLLATRGIESLDGVIRMAGGDTKVITRDALAQIVRLAKGRGVPEADAEAYVAFWVGKTKGWSLQRLPGDKPIDPLLRCGFCHVVAAAKDVKCGQCGHDLVVACPGCGQRNATERPACDCGFPIGDLPVIETRMTAARAEFNAARPAVAARACRDLLVTWPAYAPAAKLLAEAEAQQKRQDDAKAARQRRVHEADDLARARKFVAAAAVLRDLAVEGTTDLPAELRKRVDDRLNEANGLLRDGRRAESAGDRGAAIKAFEAALACCADLAEAEAALRRFPPPPVARVTATLAATCVRVEWPPVPGAGADVRYLVRRKEGGAPASESDGQQVAETADAKADDTAAAEGRAWYYAVFTVRGGAAFSRPATAAPVLRPGRPAVVRAIAARNAARIVIAPPPGHDRVDVACAPPDGKITRAGDEFEHVGLTNGREYTYQFRAAYRNPAGGAALIGEPLIVRLTPEEAPHPVTDLRLEMAGNVVRAAWTPPRVGRVVLRELDREPADLSVGLEVDAARVAKVGRDVPGQSTAAAQLPLPTVGRVVVVPFTVSGSAAVVGQWQQVNRLPDVTGVTGRPAGAGKIALQWTWPDGMRSASVTLYADDAGAQPLRTLDVTRDAYDQFGGSVQIEYGGRTPRRVKVESVSACGTFRSKGATASVVFDGRGSVRYHIDNGGLMRRLTASVGRLFAGAAPAPATRGPRPRPNGPAGGPVLVLESEQCDRVRDLVLVGLPNRLPLAADDGEVIGVLAEVELVAGRAEVPLDKVTARGTLYVRAFIRQPELQPDVRLQPAAKEQLLLKPGRQS